MLALKRRTSASELGRFFGGDALAEFVNVARSLHPDETPPYAHLIELVHDMRYEVEDEEEEDSQVWVSEEPLWHATEQQGLDVRRGRRPAPITARRT